MMQNKRFQDERYGNWLKSSLSLVYMKEALENFTEEQMRNLHSIIKTNLLAQGCLPIPPGCLCQNCLAKNIKTTGNGPRKKWELRPPCRVKICDKWLDEILNKHDHLPCPNVSWDNTNIQLFPVSHWEVAKVFQPYGCVDHQSSTDADAAALLTLMMNCTYFHQFVRNRPILQEIKEVRNNTMHSKDMLVEDADMLTNLVKILDLLTDPLHLGQLVPCQDAVIKIEQLRDNKIDLSLNRELELKALVQRTTAIGTDIKTMKCEHKVLSDDVGVLKDENKTHKAESGELKQKIERLEELKTKMEKTQKEIKSFQDFITTSGREFDQINKTLQKHETELLALLQTIARIESTLKDHENHLQQHDIEMKDHETHLQQHDKEMKDHETHFQQHDKEISQIKTKTVEHDQRIDKIETEQRTEQCREAERTDEIKKKRAELKQKLIQIYRARHLTTELSPSNPDVHVKIAEVYVQPHMQIKIDNKDKTQTIKSYKAIFQNDPKDQDLFENIYISGDAGSGKSSLCKNIVSTWCDMHKKPREKQTKYHARNTDQPFQDQAGNTDPSTVDMKFLMQRTYNLLSYRRPIFSEDLQSFTEENETTMEKIDYLFYITLRDCTSEGEVEEMIKSILPRKYHDIISDLLDDEDEQCLIILDGLDEWTPPKDHKTHSSITKGLPNREVWSKCSILTTTRPWKLAHLGLKSSEIDRHVDIKGIDNDSSRKLIDKVVKLLNKEYSRKKYAYEFEILLNEKELRGMMSVPVLLKQLICLWHDGKSIGESQCDIYFGMLELLFERAESRLSKVERYKEIKDETSLKMKTIPKCFSKANKSNKHLIVALLNCGSKLAFFTIFNNSESSILVFKKSTATDYGVSQTEMEICLKAGVLSESKHNDMCTEPTTKVSFLHKTFQEFLAALYIASLESTQDPVDHIKSTCNSVYKVLEMSKVFVFVAGMSPTTITTLSEHIGNVTSADEGIQKYRQNAADDDNDNVSQLQQLIHDCFFESELNGNLCTRLHLQDIKMKSYKSYTNNIAKYYTNVVGIKSLSMVHSCYHPDITNVQPHELQMFSFSGEGERYVKCINLDIIQFIQNSGTSLQALMLENLSTNKLTMEQFSRMINSLPCLLSIEFKWMTFTHDQYQCLVNFLSQRTQMMHIQLIFNTIDSSDDSNSDDDNITHIKEVTQSPQMETVSTDDVICKITADTETNSCCMKSQHARIRRYILDLSHHTQLQTLYISHSQWNIHTCTPQIYCHSLETCETECGGVVNSIKGALKLKTLTLHSIYTPHLVVQTVPTLTNLQHISIQFIDFGREQLRLPTLTNLQTINIEFINFGREQLRLSPDMKHITLIRLGMVTMTRTCVCGFIDSIPDTPHTVTVRVNQMTILPAEDQPQPSTSHSSDDDSSRPHWLSPWRHSRKEARLVAEYIRKSTKFESNNESYKKDEETDDYITLYFKTTSHQ